MSQENVEIVRRSQEAWNGGDLGAFLSVTPADAEWMIVEENPNARTLRGPEEIAAGEKGPEITVQLAFVTYFERGLPVRTEEYLDPRKALAPVGLSEQDISA